MHPDEGFHDHAGTVMVIAWGQFIDHDYTLTGTPLGKSRQMCYKNRLKANNDIYKRENHSFKAKKVLKH